MSTTAKKPKTMAAGESDNYFETVKRYLLECPHVPSDHPAIKAALEGMEKEQTRRERDAKLQAKFSAATTTAMTSSETTASSSTTTTTTTNLSDSMVVVDTNTTTLSPPTNDAEDDEMMEWQDVGSTKSKDDDDDDDASSFLGKALAKIAIDSISEHQVKVQSPVAAIVLIFHATLRSDLLGFSCTGIPEDESKNGSGFAAPVRELPKSLFLPPNWDTTTTAKNTLALRYRKNGTGAMVLMVTEEPDRKIQVQLQPASSKEPSQLLSFSLEEHVNLDSWNAALKVSSAVPPALHYKFLAVLLTNFLRTFDLGAIDEEVDPTATAAPYVDNTAPIMQQQQTTPHAQPSIFKSDLVPPQPTVPAMASERRRKPWEDGAAVPSTLDQAFPGTRPMHNYGDFADDLRPAGIRDPGLLPGGGRMGGNLMGPNHPMFSGGVPGPMGGPGGMQPRFDPFLPPIVDPDFDGTGIPGRNRPSRTGVPNPDHLPPPNSFGGRDMFS
jgi:hypothetical protein